MLGGRGAGVRRARVEEGEQDGFELFGWRRARWSAGCMWVSGRARGCVVAAYFEGRLARVFQHGVAEDSWARGGELEVDCADAIRASVGR